MSATIVWFRNDLRLFDNPALWAAIERGDAVVPIFVLDDVLLHGKHASANRTRFLLQSLTELEDDLRRLGSRLILRHGEPQAELVRLARAVSAARVYAAKDFSPYAARRDWQVAEELRLHGIEFRHYPGRLVADEIQHVRTAAGRPYGVFTPFYRRWLSLPRRAVLPAPQSFQAPEGLADIESIPVPKLSSLEHGPNEGPLASSPVPGGTRAAQLRLERFLNGPVHRYHEHHDALPADATSHVSSYLHFGCLSPRAVEESLPEGAGASAFRRQLAWRDFYHYVLAHNPTNATLEYQDRLRGIRWSRNMDHLEAWKSGRTGYPVVDAGMRQLMLEGYMHNRARLIVGSFLTKDLGLDWRHGELHFMRLLVDGDEANNNGNWQWIASVGVDSAPLFRRLYNPTNQSERYDPRGDYIRRYVPELATVPSHLISQPWTMTATDQQRTSCVIGSDYPKPIVNHSEARLEALKRYGQGTSE